MISQPLGYSSHSRQAVRKLVKERRAVGGVNCSNPCGGALELP